jgi:hypothetical protein
MDDGQAFTEACFGALIGAEVAQLHVHYAHRLGTSV